MSAIAPNVKLSRKRFLFRWTYEVVAFLVIFVMFVTDVALSLKLGQPWVAFIVLGTLAIAFILIGVSVYRLMRHREKLFRYPLELTMLWLDYRNKRQKWFNESFSKWDGEIFLISVMSEHSLEKIQKLVDQPRGTTRLGLQRLRVLTFDPEISDEMLRAFLEHIGEPGIDKKEVFDNKKEQVKNAWIGWTNIQTILRNRVTVLPYRLFPTLQGIVRYKLVSDPKSLSSSERRIPVDANIELFTYKTPPSERASLYIEYEKNPEIFDFFVSRFENLWDSVAKQSPKPDLSVKSKEIQKQQIEISREAETNALSETESEEKPEAVSSTESEASHNQES